MNRCGICGVYYAGSWHQCVIGQDRNGCIRVWVPDLVAALEALDTRDPERAHGQADDILLGIVPAEVREAYKRVEARCAWWAAS